MSQEAYVDAIQNRVLIRLDTLIRLRWFAIIGQLGAVLVIALGFGFPMPWIVCLILIAISAGLNLYLSRRYKVSHRLPSEGVFALLTFDVLQLGLLLYLTGGLQNPFAILLMAPVIVSSTSLPQNFTLALGAVAVAIVSALVFFHFPLPWAADTPFRMPLLFISGVWVAIVCTLGFTAIYAFRVAEETRKLADALAATELILQREQHLSALDGLAAAAAHELGTPLATIAVVAKEMEHSLPEESEFHQDAVLLRSQAQRCRDILQKLTSLSSEGESIFEQQTLLVMIEEIVEPLRGLGVTINVRIGGEEDDIPTVSRNPAIHYGLSNLIDNAVDFANESVSIDANWTDEIIEISVRDDGPGFPSAVLSRIGEPFITARKSTRGSRARGMGLGLFIAKTLLERYGAELTFSNLANQNHKSGALVTSVWKRDRLSIDKDADPFGGTIFL